MADTFRIILRDVKQYDTHQAREFDLSVGSTFPIGRASKNTTKKDLMPASHNAYIDSPVISREHAVLSIKPSSGTPQVYITDSGSMHGTMVNGHKLVPNMPELLSNGDLLQFGVDVNRNEEYFVARKYIFESQPTPPFSRGFAVPDAESEEDDDELEMYERHGSQLNPVTIDDSDSASESSTEDPEEVSEVVKEIVVLDEDVTIAPLQTAFEEYQEPQMQVTLDQDVIAVPPHAAHSTNPETATRATLEQDIESDHIEGDDIEGSCFDYSSICDEDDAHIRDFDSEAASAGSELDSELGSELESELGDIFEREVPNSESEDENEEDEVEQPKTAYSGLHSPDSTRITQALVESPLSPPMVTAREFYNFNDTASQHPFGLPPLGMFHHHTFQAEPLDEDPAPPLPPRLAAPKPRGVSLATSMQQQNEYSTWGPGEIYGTTSFFSQPMYNPYSSGPLQSPPEALSEASQNQATNDMINGANDIFRSANRMQTPPSMSTSEVISSPPAQPTRRTKVSIEEIVEEQPPTPTSVNSLKRKADVFEEEIAKMLNNSTPADTTGDATTQTTTADTAAIIAQRPKKQPRSVLSKFANAARYPLIGAAGAVASILVLSTLPDDFFL